MIPMSGYQETALPITLARTLSIQRVCGRERPIARLRSAVFHVQDGCWESMYEAGKFNMAWSWFLSHLSAGPSSAFSQIRERHQEWVGWS